MRAGLGAGTLSALQHDQFRLLFSGLIAGNIAIWLQEFATGLLVVQIAVLDGHPELAAFYLGIRSLASAVPGIALGPFAGVFADRLDRRKLLLTTRSLSALIALTLAAVVITDRATFLNVILLSGAASAAFAFDPPGRQAMLANIVPARDLFSAMGMVRAAMQLAAAIGPLIGGTLVTPLGIGGILLVRAILDVACLATLRQMRSQPVIAGARDLSVLWSLRDGVRYIAGHPLIRWAVLMQVAFAACVQPLVQLLPALTVDALHATPVELSWLFGALGLGAITGAVLVASSSGVERRGMLMLACMISAGSVLIVLGLQRTLAGAMIALLATGVLQQLFLGTEGVVLQLSTPDRLRGRVMGTQSLIFMSASPVGVLIVGSLGSLFGITTAFMIAGATLLGLGTLAMIRLDGVRAFRSPMSYAEPALPEPSVELNV